MTTMSDRLARLVTPVADDLGVTVYDIEDASGTLRILLDRPGGVDVDTLTNASRRISLAMDEDGTFSSTSLLEVSSPGLERKLRTPMHFAGAVGELVKIKLRPGIDGDRRLEGTLSAADDDSITVTPTDGAPARSASLDDVTSAHTVFVWGGAPKPGQPGSSGTQRKATKQGKPNKANKPNRPGDTEPGETVDTDDGSATAETDIDTDETEATG